MRITGDRLLADAIGPLRKLAEENSDGITFAADALMRAVAAPETKL